MSGFGDWGLKIIYGVVDFLAAVTKITYEYIIILGKMFHNKKCLSISIYNI